MIKGTLELVEATRALTFSDFPKWEIFLSPPVPGSQRFWVLRWDGVVLCKRLGAYTNPADWTCSLRSPCCGRGFAVDRGEAYCQHCGNLTVYGSEVQTRSDGAGVPIVGHARSWFEPYADPLTAELLAEEVERVSQFAETLILPFHDRLA